MPPSQISAHPVRTLSDEQGAAIARALTHPARVRILRIIGVQEGCYCGDLCQELPLAQSTISQHLKVLRGAGLIQGTPCGPAVGYCVVTRRLEAYQTWAASLTGARDQTVAPALNAASGRMEGER